MPGNYANVSDKAIFVIIDSDRARVAGSVDITYNPDYENQTQPPQNPDPGANNTVLAVALQADGRAVIGGSFNAVNTVPRNFIARMNTDGSLDLSFDPGTGADGFVNAVAIQPDGRVLIGGGFSAYNGVGRNHIARLLTNGLIDPQFNPGTGANGSVRSLALHTSGTNIGKVLIAGDFTSVNGTNRNYIARLKADGTMDDSFDPGTGANGPIHVVLIQRDGNVVVGGDFTQFDGKPRNRVARLLANGVVDVLFDPKSGADGSVFAMALAPPTISTSALVAPPRQNGTNQDTSVFQFNGAPKTGTLTIRYNFTNFAVGDTVSVVTNRLTVYEGDPSIPANIIATTGSPTNAGILTVSYGPSVTNPVFTIIINDGGRLLTNAAAPWFYTAEARDDSMQRLVLAGNFNSFDLRVRPKVARLNANGTLDTTFEPGRGFNDTVYAIALDKNLNDRPILGGLFTDFNSTRRVGLARLLEDGTLDTSFMDSSFNSFAGFIILTNDTKRNFVKALAFQTIDGNLLAGGSFSLVGSAFQNQNSITGFPRPDIRRRSNFCRIIGGETSGPGNIGFMQANYSADESQGTFFTTITRTNGSNGPGIVRFDTIDAIYGPGMATAGIDYLTTQVEPFWSGGSSGPNNVLRGLLSSGPADVIVPILEDSLIEGDEVVGLSLSIASPTISVAGAEAFNGVALGRRSASLTITDNDFEHGVLGYSEAAYTVNENAGQMRIVVTRTNGASGAVAVNYTTGDLPAGSGGAMAGTDFRLTAGRLSFAAGQISNSFSVPILDNSVVQFDRTLALLLFNPEGGATLGLSNSVLVIVEDDLLLGRINFARTNFSVVENGGSATIWVSRTGGSAGAVSIDYLTSGGNAVAGVDYTTTTGVLSWASGESGPKMFTVPVVDNGLVDGLREARLILTNASVAGAIGVTNEARLAIADDDAYGTLSFSRASYLANENGGNALVTIVRQGGVAGDVFVGSPGRLLAAQRSRAPTCQPTIPQARPI